MVSSLLANHNTSQPQISFYFVHQTDNTLHSRPTLNATQIGFSLFFKDGESPFCTNLLQRAVCLQFQINCCLMWWPLTKASILSTCGKMANLYLCTQRVKVYINRRRDAYGTMLFGTNAGQGEVSTCKYRSGSGTQYTTYFPWFSLWDCRACIGLF